MAKGLCKEYDDEKTFLDGINKVTGAGLRAHIESAERDGKKIFKVCAVRKRDTKQLKQQLGW